MFENLDDPRKQALLALAAGLLSPVRGRGMSGFGEALGQGINAGLLGYNAGARTQEATKRGEMDRRLEAARLAQLEQAQKAQEYMGQGINKFLRPGVGAQPLTPVDDNGNPMPSPTPSFDQGGFAQYLAQNPATAREALNFMPKPQAPISLKQGEVLLDPTTRQPLFRNEAPVKPAFQPGQTRTYEQGRTRITEEYQPDGKWKVIGRSAIDKPDGEPKPVFNEAAGGFIVPPSNGRGPSVIPVPGFTPPPKNQPSETELTAGGYAQRMIAANDLLSKLPEDAIPGLRQTIANNKYPTLAPYVSSPEQQQYRQLQEDWVRAKLRKESGAVIADEEMAREIRVYFPQPGDSPAVIKQKELARERANSAMILAAGKARGMVSGGSQTPTLADIEAEILRRRKGQ